MAKPPNDDRKPGAEPPASPPGPPPEPAVEIWSGGLQWALKAGYRPTDTLAGVRQELGLWLENLNELIQAFGPKAHVGDVLARAGDPEGWEPGQAPDLHDDEDG